jgi:isochorismate synthase
MSDVAPPDLPTRLAAGLDRAARIARESGHAVLLSVVVPIAPVDPLGALAAVMQHAARAPEVVGALGHDRMFWTHPASGLAMAGMGSATEVRSTSAGRFRDADEAWRQLLAHAVVDTPGAGSTARGPILMGGFAFDDEGPRSPRWRDFPAARFAVPALLVTTEGDTAHLTLSTLVSDTGAPSVDVRTLRSLVGAIGHASPVLASSTPPAATLQYDDLRPADAWCADVDRAVAAIREGSFAKVVLARAVETMLPGAIDTIALLDHLRRRHHESYVFGVWHGESAFVGASPERLVRLDGRQVQASSLAGSTPRSESAEEDDALARRLLASAKDLAEHDVVRHALVDALAALCDDVTANATPSLLALPHVHHLHTRVRASLRAGHSLLELVGLLHPTPAVGGAPRAAALAFLRAHESLDRGWYAAPVGWVGRDEGEFAVALRSALLADASATLYAGCGIVAASDATNELAESRVKLRPMQAALGAVASVGSRPSEGPAMSDS